MDLLLENGDLKKDSSGKPIPISGFDELKQQIYIRLKAKLGGFIYDRKLGSEITAKTENSELIGLIRKALPQLFDVDLISARIEEGTLKAKFDSGFGDFMIEIPFEDKEG